jgi:outer membrane protein assembly factor BamB
VRSFEAATGKLLWKFDTNPPDAKWDRERPAFSTRNYLPATAVFHANRVYIGNGQEVELYGRLAWLYCIDPTKSGNISPYLTEGPDKGKPNPNSGMVWKYGGVDKRTEHNKFNSTVSNVAVAEGLVIAPDSTGEVHCLDSQTGQRYWVHDTDGGSIEGNPLIVDGKIYVEAGFGVCILALAKEKKVLGTIEMDWSAYCSPIFANGVLYVTTGTTIFAIAGDKKEPKK